MIVRGNTQLQHFEVPFAVGTIEDLSIVYMQKGEVKISKDLSNVELDSEKDQVNLILQEEDTLSFDKYDHNYRSTDSLICIQMRVMLNDNTCLTSETIKERLGAALDAAAMATEDASAASVMPTNTYKPHFYL